MVVQWCPCSRAKTSAKQLYYTGERPLQFFTGFCLIANGCYLGVGTFFDVGDAGDLARYGCPRWLMLLYGLVCVPTGLFLWNGLGPHFGLGEAQGKVDCKAALVTLAIVLIVVVVEGTAAVLLTGSPKP